MKNGAKKKDKVWNIFSSLQLSKTTINPYTNHQKTLPTMNTAVKSALNTSKQLSQQSISALNASYMNNIQLFTNYNFREYFKRKYQREFEKLNTEFATNDANAISHYQQLTEELRLVKRQTIINQLYKFDELIVEQK